MRDCLFVLPLGVISGRFVENWGIGEYGRKIMDGYVDERGRRR